MAMTYAEQLRHPNWQKRRLEAMQTAKFLCQSCFCGDQTLHVHHKQYFKGRLAWEYEDDELAVLCEACHIQVHYDESSLKKILSTTPIADFGDLRDIVGVLVGYLGYQELSHESDFEPEPFMCGFVAMMLRSADSDVMLRLVDHLRDCFEDKSLRPKGIGYSLRVTDKVRKIVDFLDQENADA